MQRHWQFVGLSLLACAGAPHAWAAHTDVIVESAAGQITTNSAPGTPENVFESELGELGIPGFADDPGFASSALPPGARIGYNVLDALLFWDGSGQRPPAGERLEISLLGILQTTVTESTGFQAGPFFAQASGSGAIHQHLSFYVKVPDFDEGDPFDNPVSEGAYVLVLELYSDALDTSVPWAIVFNNGLSQSGLDAGVNAVSDYLNGGPSCPGDITGDSVVDLSDLSRLLANFGAGSGQSHADGDLDGDGDIDLTDLSELLLHFGETCG